MASCWCLVFVQHGDITRCIAELITGVQYLFSESFPMSSYRTHFGFELDGGS